MGSSLQVFKRLVFWVGCEEVGSEGCFFVRGGIGEMFLWGGVFGDGVGGMFLLYPSVVIILIPVFYGLKLTSVYEVSLWGGV